MNREENKMEIEQEDKKEEEKEEKKEQHEKNEENVEMKVEKENKNSGQDWGDDSKDNKNTDNAWGSDANDNNNNNGGWGSTEENKAGDGWGSSEANQENTNNNVNDQAWGNDNSTPNNNPNLEALANEMQQSDDKDIREDTGPLPELKATEDTFALCEDKKENKMTWFNRDGRNNEKDPFIEKEIEKLLKEHDVYAARKEDKTSEMESLEFKAYYVRIYSNDPPEELPEKKRPKIRFDDMNKLPEELAKNVKRLKFDYLTPIQRMVMPYIQVGKDIVCIAETGSGKTISYLFPIIGQMLISGVPENPFLNDKVEEKKEEADKKEGDTSEDKPKENKKSYFSKKVAYPLCLVLVPTRELAIQVAKESKKLSFNTGIRTVAVYGGETKKYQTIELSKGCDIMVATPGRLIDLLEKGLINLKMIKYLIMDEADRMLDQNFYEDIKNIIGHTTKRKERQNLLFSATFNDDIKGLAKYFLNNYYYFRPVLESPKQIKHEFIRVQNDNDKTNALISFLKKPETKDKSILIFLRTKNGVDELGNIMKEENIPYCTIHGDKIQADRIKSISEFSSGKKNVLIATDVASRGLDFPNVYCVVNFDLPQTNDDYIHRVGRTGRVGQEGRALTFIDGMDETNRIKLIHFLKNQGQEIPEWIDDSISQKKYRFFAANKRKKDEEGNDNNNNEDNDGFKKPFKKKRFDDNNDNNNGNSSWGNNENSNNNAGSSWDNDNKNSWGNNNN
ncbi:MAG: DEAD/DEAH box helicase, partial [Clostridia bacterium]|nr:DEAD/DEAH box helicase [Clostridia bacterium]